MKKIKMALSIAVLFGTMAVIGVSSSQVAFAEADGTPRCDCEFENPHGWGVITCNGCEAISCWHPIDAD